MQQNNWGAGKRADDNGRVSHRNASQEVFSSVVNARTYDAFLRNYCWSDPPIAWCSTDLHCTARRQVGFDLWFKKGTRKKKRWKKNGTKWCRSSSDALCRQHTCNDTAKTLDKTSQNTWQRPKQNRINNGCNCNGWMKKPVRKRQTMKDNRPKKRGKMVCLFPHTRLKEKERSQKKCKQKPQESKTSARQSRSESVVGACDCKLATQRFSPAS